VVIPVHCSHPQDFERECPVRCLLPEQGRTIVI
jgi:hypothetical protein